ncbi:MAG: succinate dehydrogenase, cytochrome b556 subunit [Methylophilaceae bacterium]|jgi:succinate dehydrogenase / fumarate reductase cytochrome b subunit|nr:succinate dehydrogenase, cytochrome b556 subunit [Methylophilaceae bacterium]
MMQRKRPVKNLDLFTIRLPINAVVSIMHRAAGIVLFLLLPLMLIAFQQSLASEASYLALQQLFSHWLIKLFFIASSWAFFHHFYAGIRHFLQDVHWMSSLEKARLTGRVVLVLVGLSILLFAWSIF